MRIKPTMSMFTRIEDLNIALARWYQEENEELKKTLRVIARRPEWTDHHCRAQHALNRTE